MEEAHIDGVKQLADLLTKPLGRHGLRLYIMTLVFEIINGCAA